MAFRCPKLRPFKLMRRIYVIGKVMGPVDPSRFSIPKISNVIDVTFQIVSGKKSSHCERISYPSLALDSSFAENQEL